MLTTVDTKQRLHKYHCIILSILLLEIFHNKGEKNSTYLYGKNTTNMTKYK